MSRRGAVVNTSAWFYAHVSGCEVLLVDWCGSEPQGVANAGVRTCYSKAMGLNMVQMSLRRSHATVVLFLHQHSAVRRVTPCRNARLWLVGGLVKSHLPLNCDGVLDSGRVRATRPTDGLLRTSTRTLGPLQLLLEQPTWRPSVTPLD